MRLIGLLCLAGLLTCCGREPSGEGTRSVAIDVLCAASTAHVVEALARQYEQEHAGIKVRCNAGASSTLARQIEQGAPADLYISANVKWMDYLAGRGLIQDDSRRDLLSNSLMLIAPRNGGHAAGSQAVGDVLTAGSGRIAIGDPDHVPAGMYARQALMDLGLWTKVEARIIPAKDVRSALLLVERGEAEWGIVYATDAKSSEAVSIVASFPRDAHDPIVYPAAMVKGASQEASAFYTYMCNEVSRAAFERAGFGFVGQD